MREWLSGGAPPCQGGGRGFDPRLALEKRTIPNRYRSFFRALAGLESSMSTLRSGPRSPRSPGPRAPSRACSNPHFRFHGAYDTSKKTTALSCNRLLTYYWSIARFYLHI